MATPRARRATTPFGQAVRGPNPSQIVESTILTANPANLTRRDPSPSPAQRRTPAARPIYSDSESSEDDLWRAPASVLLVDGTPGRGAMRAARQAETMEELEIDPPPARVSSSSGRAGPSPRSTPGYDPGSDDGMEYEDSDLEREADEYRAMLVGASGGGGRVFRNIGAFTTPKPRGADGSSSRRGFRGLSPGASSFGSAGPVRGSLHRPSPTSSGGAPRAVDFETTAAREGVGDGDGRDGGYVAAEEFSVKEEFEAIRRELAEIKSNMSSPATAAATPNDGGGGGGLHLDGGTPGRGEYPHGPHRASAGSFGGSVARDVHSGGGVVRQQQQQQRRDSNGSTDGGGRPRWGGSGHVGSHRSAGSSKTSGRHRSGRKVSSEATGTGRLLFGDDDGDRSGGVGGEPASAAREPGVGADDSVRRRGGESGAVNRRHSTGEDEAPGSNDSSLNRHGGSGPGSNESSFRHGASFDRTRSQSPRESTRVRATTRETAVNTDRSEAEEGGGVPGRSPFPAEESPSRKSAGREVSGGESVVVSALRLFALMLLLAGTWYMVLVIVDVIEEDFLSGRLPRSNLFLDSLTSLTRTPLEFLTGKRSWDGLDDDPPFAAPT